MLSSLSSLFFPSYKRIAQSYALNLPLNLIIFLLSLRGDRKLLWYDPSTSDFPSPTLWNFEGQKLTKIRRSLYSISRCAPAVLSADKLSAHKRLSVRLGCFPSKWHQYEQLSSWTFCCAESTLRHFHAAWDVRRAPHCKAVPSGEWIRKNGIVGSTLAQRLTSSHHLVAIVKS